MLEWLQITAQYSNAVLVAILPHISDFVKRVELPMPAPVMPAQVAKFRCYPLKDDVGGAVTLTNGLWFVFAEGHVRSFRTPHSYYNLQDPQDVPKFFGTPKLSQEEALAFARGRIVRLGYTLKETFTDQEPSIDPLPTVGTNIVPHYRFQWKDPVFGQTAVSVEVDAARKMVQEMRMSSRFFSRAPPKVSVEPQLRDPERPVSATASNEFLGAALPKVSEFVRKLELPCDIPVTRDSVKQIAFVNGDADIRIQLTNGYWFGSQYGVIAEFNAPETVYGRQPPSLDAGVRPVDEYLGQWKLGESEAVALARKAITNLGYKVGDFYAERAPLVLKPEPVGNYVVPRYGLHWLTNEPASGGTIAMVRAEVDANKGRLLHFTILGAALPYDTQKKIIKEGKRDLKQIQSLRPMSLNTNSPRDLHIDAEFLKYFGEVLNPTNMPKLPPPDKRPNPFE